MPPIDHRTTAAATLLLCALAAPSGAAEVESSLFAMITHKGGFASGKAHDHLIATGEPRLELTWSGSLEGARLTLEAMATELVVDDDALRSELYPRLEELAILDEPFGELSEEDRAKIRETLLSKKQLDAERHPQITATAGGLRAEPSELGSVAFTHTGTVTLTAHGQSVERPFRARLEVTDEGTQVIEAVGEAAFTDFGIKPYSAFLGAVKNLDGFHFYARLVVRE